MNGVSLLNEKKINEGRSAKLFGKYHEVVLLLIGVLFTSLIGGALGYYFQEKSWENQNREKRYDAEISKASEVFDEVSRLLDRRSYRTRRLIWAYKDNDSEGI